MRSTLWRLVALLCALTLGSVALADAGPAPAVGAPAQDRLVLFESFMNPDCGVCSAAAPHIQRLAQEYDGKAVFLEQHAAQPLGDRYSRFWAAYEGQSAGYPIVTIDSGAQITQGSHQDFYGTYKTLVDVALARQADAEVALTATWLSNTIDVSMTITNTGDVALSYSGNRAKVHALVYETGDVGKTGQLVCGGASQRLATELGPGESAVYHFVIDELAYGERVALSCVALIDYRPGVDSGPFDMLQAAVAPVAGLKPTAFVPLALKSYQGRVR